MGSYLSKPRTEIDSSIQENEQFICCTAEMQGWRKTQEDAHVAILNYDDNGTAFFAVFDGHGGHEISKYCAQNLPDFIKKSSFYKEKKISDALEESFLKFDNTLKEPNVLAELKKLADLNDISDIDDDETSTLRKEASIPIEEIIARNFKIRYGENSNDDDDHDDHKDGKDGEKVQNGNNEENSDEKESSSSSSSSKPLSSLEMAKKNSLLLKSETLKAFLQDYLDEEDDDDEEDDESADEEEEENGESPGDSSSNDDEEDDDEDLDDDDDDDDVPDSREDIATGLKNVFNMDYEPGKGSGCTAIVAVIRDDKIYVANAGDSRCVLSRNGQAIQMSEDHKPEDEREKERIINAGGEITNDGRVNGGLNLSRAIGDHMYKNNPNVTDREQMITALPDILTLPIDKEKDDFLFLACDGIWNSMNSQEVVDFIQKRLKDTDDLKEICSELFKTCLAPSTDGDGSGCDNMTCILVRFKKSNSENSLNNNNKNGNIVSIKRPLEDQDSTTTNDQNGTSNDEHHSESLTTNKRIKNDDEKIADNVNDDVYNKPGSSRD